MSYPNHSYFKKQGRIKLDSVDSRCEDCGEEATDVHHLDGGRDNHELCNLKALCHKCHISNYHSRKQSTCNVVGRKFEKGSHQLTELSDYLENENRSEFAKAVGITEPLLSSILTGKRKASLELCNRIAQETCLEIRLPDLRPDMYEDLLESVRLMKLHNPEANSKFIECIENMGK